MQIHYAECLQIGQKRCPIDGSDFKIFNDKSEPFFSLLNLNRRLDKNNVVLSDLQVLYRMESEEKASSLFLWCINKFVTQN